ncbi:MAG TPA: DUF2867 domain-containing protein [Thermoanaerobaculia bacterium]|nr:DUF2867 domain-containing protein [Thermoanaerobaculia bacterium]
MARANRATGGEPPASGDGDRQPAAFCRETRRFVERRERLVAASAAAVYAVFSRLGGTRGWLAFDGLWRLRGAVDRMVGGVGLRRGRRDPDQLRVGDAVDFWRVEAIEPQRMVRLRAEMKVPGQAWLQFEAIDLTAASGEPAQCRFVQIAFFAPRGFAGLAYWYALFPIHGRIFSRLADRIAAAAL